ncbi:MAG: rod-binding protein [Deltaproteobacteria bacterium]|nr:rod-binding protein [Deltaproteobacteria bacterium]
MDIKPVGVDTGPIANPQLHEVAEEFEALFLDIVMRAMRKSVTKSGFIDGGNAEEIYASMLDSEYAKLMSKQGVSGLADNIERQLNQMQGRHAYKPPRLAPP